MSVEQNKALIRRWYDEIWNKQNLEVIDELAAPDFVSHRENVSREQVKEGIAGMFAAFTECSVRIEDMFAEGDKVCTRTVISSRHTGEYMDIPATGKEITIPGISVHRIVDGQITDDWASADMLDVMQQLGAIPT